MLVFRVHNDHACLLILQGCILQFENADHGSSDKINTNVSQKHSPAGVTYMLYVKNGDEGIRTLVTVARQTHFGCAPL